MVAVSRCVVIRQRHMFAPVTMDSLWPLMNTAAMVGLYRLPHQKLTSESIYVNVRYPIFSRY